MKRTGMTNRHEGPVWVCRFNAPTVDCCRLRQTPSLLNTEQSTDKYVGVIQATNNDYTMAKVFRYWANNEPFLLLSEVRVWKKKKRRREGARKRKKKVFRRSMITHTDAYPARPPKASSDFCQRATWLFLFFYLFIPHYFCFSFFTYLPYIYKRERERESILCCVFE